MTDGKSPPQFLSKAERDSIIINHLKLVDSLAARQAAKIPSLREELVGVARLALVMAAESFAQGANCQFSTYATYKINGAMLDFLREQDHMPRESRIIFKKLIAEQNSALTPDSISEAIERLPCKRPVRVFLKEAAARLLRGVSATISLDDPKVGSVITDAHPSRGKTPEEIAIQNNIEQVIKSSISRLPVRLRDIVLAGLYPNDPIPQKQIAERLGVHASRISQLQSEAKTALRVDPELRKLARHRPTSPAICGSRARSVAATAG